MAGLSMSVLSPGVLAVGLDSVNGPILAQALEPANRR